MIPAEARHFDIWTVPTGEAHHVAAVLNGLAHLPRWTPEELARLLAHAGVAVLADGVGAAVGQIAGGEGELLALGVREDARGRGWGAALLRALEDAAAREGAGVMHLDVSAENAAARELYEKAGYERTGRRRRYYCDGTDAIAMRKTLKPLNP